MKYIREITEYSTATDAALELDSEKHGCPFIFKVDNNLELNCGEGDYLTCYHYADDSFIVNRDQVPDGDSANYHSNIENYTTLTECNVGKYCTEIPQYAFNKCTILTSVYMPKVTSIGMNAFQDCSVLSSVSNPNVIRIGNNAFYHCSVLTSVYMPKVTYIGGSSFAYCSVMSSVSMPNVTSIGVSTFFACNALSTVSIHNVERLESMIFKYCKTLSSVRMPNAAFIGNSAFECCSALTTVSMPKVTSIGSLAFRYCSSLSSVYLPDTPPTLSNANAFSDTPTSLKFYVSSQVVKDKYKAASNWNSFTEDKFVVLT